MYMLYVVPDTLETLTNLQTNSYLTGSQRGSYYSKKNITAETHRIPVRNVTVKY